MSKRKLFGEIIDSAVSVSSEESLREGLARIVARYGFETFAYLNLHAARSKSFAVSNYPDEWQSIYFVRSYMVIDPVITMGKRIMRAFQWSVDQQRRFATGDERGFWDTASDFGIRNGLTVPIRVGPGRVAMLTLASAVGGQDAELVTSDVSLAATAVTFLHSRLGHSKHPTKTREPGLTDREALCMRWSAAGMPMNDIATITGLTFHTVRWDLDNVRAKLSARNLKEALAIASSLRLM